MKREAEAVTDSNGKKKIIKTIEDSDYSDDEEDEPEEKKEDDSIQDGNKD
jgi:hypothetical protein